jgi:hypothetical protein
MWFAKIVRAVGLFVVVGVVGMGGGCGSGGPGASTSETTKPDSKTLKAMRKEAHTNTEKGVVPGKPAFKKKGMGG